MRGGEKIKQNEKIITHTLIIASIILLAVISLQAGFAATTTTIDNQTSGGISGALSTSTDGDTIELDEGTYTGNNNTNMTINKNITITGKTKDKVILDAKGLSGIYTIGNNSNVTFINITFCNGNFTSGGAIYNSYAETTMTFVNCTFVQNSASTNGGAIYNRGNLTIDCSIFLDNFANSGGAIYTTTLANSVFNVDVNIFNSIFNNNIAGNSAGGVIITSAAGSVINFKVFNSSFTRNTANNDSGGGLYIGSGANSNVTVDIFNSTFANNFVYRNGGGIAINSGNNSNVNVTISDSIINDNFANENGGGIHETIARNYLSVVTLVINNSTLIGNSAGGNGGGIHITTGNNSRGDSILVIKNSNISDNSAGDNGGGISVSTGTNSEGNNAVIVDNSTISGNSGNSAVSISSGENSTGNSNVAIFESDIVDNDGDGIHNEDGNLTIIGSNISNNMGNGISTSNNGNSTIVDNEIVGNGGHGVSNEGNSTIEGNIINDNIGDGIKNGENGTADITDNEIVGNGGSGVNNDGDATVNDNVINDNAGDDIVNNGTINGSGNTNNVQSILTINTTVSDNKITIRVKATDKKGNAIVGRLISFYVNGKLVGSGITNNQGIAEFVYAASSAGKYNILATMDGFNESDTIITRIYSPANASTIANVLKKGTIIVVSAPTIKEGKKTNIKVTLKDINGNIIKNKKISLKIKGKTYTATTNNNGIAVFKIAALKGGKHTLIAKFTGDSNYKSSTTKAVQKINPKSNLGIVSIKKLSTNKRLSTCKVTIANKGSLKSKATTLALFHMRKGIKIKTKYIKIKSIAPGKKISIIVSYFPDKANHRYCKAHFQVDPKNKNKEIILANNKKSISLKH